MTGGAFEVVRSSGPAAILAGAGGRFIDLYDWLQLTLGRFLAPAREADGGVEYLVLGADDPGDSTVAESRDEVARFREAVAAVGEHLREQIDSDALCRSHVLLSLDALLGLTLPDPSDDSAYHLRGGLLQVCNWGLTGGTTIAQLISDIRTSRRGEEPAFFRQLRATLERKYHLPPRPTNGLPRSDYRIPAPAAQPLPPLPEPAGRDPHAALQEFASASQPANGRALLANDPTPTVYLDEESVDAPPGRIAKIERAVRRFARTAPAWALAAGTGSILLVGILVGLLLAATFGRPATTPAVTGPGVSSGLQGQSSQNIEAGRFGTPERTTGDSPGR